jgi:hypothetical protein
VREFEGKGSRLARLSPPAKWLYASFNLLSLFGMFTSLALYWDSMGVRLSSTAAWWLGDAPGADSMDIHIEKSPRYLLELTHQHLFTMPVVMLVLGHLFLLSRGDARFKTAIVVAAPVITFLHVAGPWVIWLGGPNLAWWMPLTGIPYVAIYVFMALWPLPELVRSE